MQVLFPSIVLLEVFVRNYGCKVIVHCITLWNITRNVRLSSTYVLKVCGVVYSQNLTWCKCRRRKIKNTLFSFTTIGVRLLEIPIFYCYRTAASFLVVISLGFVQRIYTMSKWYIPACRSYHIPNTKIVVLLTHFRGKGMG